MRLSDTLNKTISDFCLNRFTASNENHCAHYVCHVLELDSGYDCRVHTGKRHPGAGLRVHELFATCPHVGVFDNISRGPCIVFVTAVANVNLQEHTMRNVPQKHVGIYDGTNIYHYSNTQDVVVRQTPQEFLRRFQGAYTGNQGLFFGEFPAGASLPDMDIPEGAPILAAAPLAAQMRPTVGIRKAASGNTVRYYATMSAGEEFYVAQSVTYQTYKGLHQTGSLRNGPRYDSAPYIPLYGSAAAMVGVIGEGESSGYFNRLNTYDRAAFTFGFFQLAAHTPNDNLILLFRRLTSSHVGFQEHFPDLILKDGKLHKKVDETSTINLEQEYPRPGRPRELNLKSFMSYLNPAAAAVDEVEVDNAARLVWLSNIDSAMRDTQVNLAVEITMKKLRTRYDPWYALNGESDLVCTAIADIHHQGRGTTTQVRQALRNSSIAEKLRALCSIGEASYASRCQTLRQALKAAERNGTLGAAVFDRASGLFRPITGWV